MASVVVFGLIVAALTAGATAGIVALAKRWQEVSQGERVLLVVGMVFLGTFAVGGMAAMGCAAMAVFGRV